MVGLRFLPETNWARPTVPPAPGMFTTCTPEASLDPAQRLLAAAAWSWPLRVGRAMISKLLISARLEPCPGMAVAKVAARSRRMERR